MSISGPSGDTAIAQRSIQIPPFNFQGGEDDEHDAPAPHMSTVDGTSKQVHSHAEITTVLRAPVSPTGSSFPLPDRQDESKGLSTLTASNVSYSVRVKGSDDKALVHNVSMRVHAGEMLAIMGPSGAGKSTLLDLLSGRKVLSMVNGSQGSMTMNGRVLDKKAIRTASAFVEQEDALLGVLTARESISYALRLASPHLRKREVVDRVETVILMLGLSGCSEQTIGTPLKRGLSGGQKIRVSIGCALVTYPRILFLDEPTSGLDSHASQEVVLAVRNVARKEGIFVIATIHQPSLATINAFSRLLLLAEGKVAYEGRVEDVERYLNAFGVEVPRHVVPTDVAMSLINTDFDSDSMDDLADGDETTKMFPTNKSTKRDFAAFYQQHASRHAQMSSSPSLTGQEAGDDSQQSGQASGVTGAKLMAERMIVLGERALVNYSRNLLVYGIRLGMYAGMGVMLATIWVRLGDDSATINDRLSVHFFAVAFLSFMSVAGIPGFIEERSVFKKETSNGLYTTLPFVIANSIVNIPFLFACSVVFVLIMYWGIGLNPSASAVFRYIGFLFLAIYTAESQMVVIAAGIPIFVAALAIGAFVNGFWMSVGGYFIRAINLPRFWYRSFHWMDYQTYAFALLTNSDFRGLTFECVNDVCAYPSTIGPQQVSGQDVLNYLQIGGISYGTYAGILIAIAFIMRVLLYLALRFIR